MKNLVAFPLLALVVILQSAIVSRVTLLSGCADLMLLVLVAWSLQPQVESAWQWALLGGLMVAFVSGQPFFVPVAGYVAAVLMSRMIQNMVWQMPVLALFSVTFFATFLIHLLTFFALWLTGTPLSIGDVVAWITLPSISLNFLLVMPVHAVIRDLALWVYPLEEMA